MPSSVFYLFSSLFSSANGRNDCCPAQECAKLEKPRKIKKVGIHLQLKKKRKRKQLKKDTQVHPRTETITKYIYRDTTKTRRENVYFFTQNQHEEFHYALPSGSREGSAPKESKILTTSV
jgi:hypothetical protein